MKTNKFILLAGLGSFAMLMGAFAFQHIGGMAPCKLCIWQRYPHGLAIALALLGILHMHRIWILGGALATFTTGGIGIYHTGVERKWWEGPTSCTSSSVADQSSTDLFNSIMNAPLVQCDQVAWEMFGLSMASWNAVISFALVGLWLLAYRVRA